MVLLGKFVKNGGKQKNEKNIDLFALLTHGFTMYSKVFFSFSRKYFARLRYSNLSLPSLLFCRCGHDASII